MFDTTLDFRGNINLWKKIIVGIGGLRHLALDIYEVLTTIINQVYFENKLYTV